MYDRVLLLSFIVVGGPSELMFKQNGMATFEGPLLSIRSVSSLGHYTDWIIGHVHGGALGWNGFMAAGMFYWMVPRLFGTKLYSRKLADAHFYLAVTLEKMGQSEESKAHWRAYQRLAPNGEWVDLAREFSE